MQIFSSIVKWFAKKQTTVIIPSEIDNKFDMLKMCISALDSMPLDYFIHYKAIIGSRIYMTVLIPNVFELLEVLLSYDQSLTLGGDLSNIKVIQDYNANTLLLDDYLNNAEFYISPSNAITLLNANLKNIYTALQPLYDSSPDYYDRKLTLILREVCVAIQTLYTAGIEHDQETQNARPR